MGPGVVTLTYNPSYLGEGQRLEGSLFKASPDKNLERSYSQQNKLDVVTPVCNGTCLWEI
jgi:hypothetical protein